MNNSARLILPLLETEERLKVFGANVRRERTLRRISQAALATRAALYVRTVARIEAGELRVRAETIDRIREALACSGSDLLRGCSGLPASLNGAEGAHSDRRPPAPNSSPPQRRSRAS